MSIGETTSDDMETIGDTAEERIMQRLDHIDDQLHEIRRFIDKYLPMLERFTGSRMLGWMGGRKDG